MIDREYSEELVKSYLQPKNTKLSKLMEYFINRIENEEIMKDSILEIFEVPNPFPSVFLF